MADRIDSLISEHNKMKAPFICKIKFNAPSRFKAENAMIQQKNAAHIQYIGTRPGVENVDESQLRESIAGTSAGHVRYIDERPRSHGLFSGLGEKPDMAAIQEELLHHKGVVWRVVLSLTEEDAKKLDYTDRKSWETALRATVPDAAAKMGIGETNLRWVAAFHQEQGHPHVHLVMWENQPKRRKGKLSHAERVDVQKTFQNVIYAEERSRLFQEKTATRDLIRDLSKNELVDVVSVLRDLRKAHKDVELELQSMGAGTTGISPKITNPYAAELAKRIDEIGEAMPQKGRIAYKFMPVEVKAAVDETTKWLLNQHSFKESIEKYKGAVEDMTRQYTFKEADIKKAIDKAMVDLEKRVSQHVLRAAAESRKFVGRTVIPEKAAQVVEAFSQAMGKPEQNLDHEVVTKSVEALSRYGYFPDRQEQIVRKWMDQAKLNVSEEDLKAIIAKVETFDHSELSGKEKVQNTAAVMKILKLSGHENEYISRLLDRSGLNEEDVTSIKASMKQLEKKANDIYLGEVEWNRLTKNMGVTAAYPWVPGEEVTLLHDQKEAFIKELKKASFAANVSDSEKGYTTFCVNVALKQLGVADNERSDIILDLAQRSGGIKGINNILQTVNEAETNYLKKQTWSRLSANLNLKSDYPWHTEDIMVRDTDKFRAAVDEFKQAAQKLVAPDESKWTAETLAKCLRLEHTGEDVKLEVQQWASRTGNLDESQVNELDLLKKRTDDSQILSKQFGIKDQVNELITNFTKVLIAAGLDKEQLKKIILDWNKRSGAGIDEDRIGKLVDSVEKSSRDAESWGRPPVVSKKDFKNLCDTLKVNTDYIWEGRNSKDYRSYESGHSMDFAKLLWKQAWDAVEQERMRTHAQGEMLKRQMERQRIYQAQRERDE
ncbi:MobP3 family relaxase [Paenibacillus agilis]|uniref:Conjugation protein n=1 Tax=Paenibacillus agilis TaxID=3020863 RepID=A0A559ID87_9BACL|nr:MobP3 family relaxase [Paenibacillus agilis]TVX85632.1 conjugation protein [Paenibacillus agilis]